VKQLSGEYKVKSPGLRFVHARVKRLASMIKHFEIHHVDREQNKDADALARKAIKEAKTKPMTNDESMTNVE